MEYNIKIIENNDYNLVGTSEIPPESEAFEELKLTPEDLDEYHSISNSTYRRQWIGARWLATQCRKKMSRNNFEIQKRPSGKLYVEGDEFHVSMSHNSLGAAVMFSTMPCGIDVEIFRPKIRVIAKKFLTAEEDLNIAKNTEALTLIWSAKESAYKMLDYKGLIFKEQLNCKIGNINNKGSFIMEIFLPNQGKKNVLVKYAFLEEQVLTYLSLADAL